MLLICLFVSVVLFADGIWALMDINKNYNKRYDVKLQNVPIEKPSQESSITHEEPVNLLVLGLDKEEVRSDVIVLFNYSPEFGKVNILSIARDTRVFIKGKAVKINALVGMGGEQLIADRIENMTGIPVDYYLTLNFDGFKEVVDTLGGVQVNVPINMNYDDPDQDLHIHLQKGIQILNGDEAEQFVRYRKGNRQGQGYSDGDIGRITAQQEFIKALVQQKFKLKYLSKADDIYSILREDMRTNIEIGDIRHYIKGLKNIHSEEINTFTIPGESTYKDNLWYFIYDNKKTHELVDSYFFK